MPGASLRAIHAAEGSTISGPSWDDQHPGWWIHARVAEYLSVDKGTLRRRMGETPDHIEKPWTNYGTEQRPRWSWCAAGIDEWWIEVNAWRVSRNGTASGAFDGGTPTAVRGRGRSRRNGPQPSLRAKSKTTSGKAGGGNLAMLAKQLTSTR